MTRRTCRAGIATVAIVGATLLGACSSDDGSDAASDFSATEMEATPAPTSGLSGELDAGDTTDEDAGEPADVSGGQVISVGAVTCETAPADDPTTSTPVPCDQAHTTETFVLTGTDDLDDCYRAVAASSDVAVGVDEFDETELDFTDERISGHSFSGFGGEVTCSVFLAEPSSTPLVGR